METSHAVVHGWLMVPFFPLAVTTAAEHSAAAEEWNKERLFEVVLKASPDLALVGRFLDP